MEAAVCRDRTGSTGTGRRCASIVPCKPREKPAALRRLLDLEAAEQDPPLGVLVLDLDTRAARLRIVQLEPLRILDLGFEGLGAHARGIVRPLASEDGR